MPSDCTSAKRPAGPGAERAPSPAAPGPIAVAGLTQLTTVDYPGMLSAVLFCQGCPWRCGYCHNPHLIPRGEGAVPWTQVTNFLRRRTGLLDAVVISGGEPLLQAGLSDAIREIRAAGFRVGLHTAGPYPSRLLSVLPQLDWVGFDVKTDFSHYEALTGVRRSGDRARLSLTVLLQSGTACEVRTTLDTSVSADTILALADRLSGMGVRRYVLQQCRREGRPLGHALIEDRRAQARLRAQFDYFELRLA